MKEFYFSRKNGKYSYEAFQGEGMGHIELDLETGLILCTEQKIYYSGYEKKKSTSSDS